jgi:hypothetical protein
MEGRAMAVFTINDAAVSTEYQTRGVRVLFNGKPVAKWKLGPARDLGDQRILLPPGAFRDGEAATVAFEIEDPKTPVDLGWSTWDKRPLGFRLARMRVAPAGRLNYRLGDAIDFLEGGDSLVFQEETAAEWSLPGVRGSWTVGPRAGFRVPFETPPAGEIRAAFIISDCMIGPASPSLAVAVRANGRDVGKWTLTNRRPHCQSIHIPADVTAASPALAITFEISDPRSPASLGWSTDARPLGFQLARAVIGRDHAEIPKFKAVGRERPLYQRILGLPQYALHVARILWRRYRA